MSNIKNVIKSIRDIMRKDAGVDGDAQRISQMVWMMFLKIFSDNEERWAKELPGYKSPIPNDLKWQNWVVAKKDLTGTELIDFINNRLFPQMKTLVTDRSEQAKIVKTVFEDTHNYMKNGILFRQVVNEFDKINFGDTNDEHVFNDIYESILKELQNAGTAGEFYTPRAVTQFMVDVVNPRNYESVLDPACGTGGFLTSTIENIKKSYDVSEDHSYLNESNIRGIEKKPLPHLLCITNLMLHGLRSPNISRDNLLSRKYDSWTGDNQVDVVLSNPPFGGSEEEGIEINFPAMFRTKETADLFMVLIIKLLKKNGRAAVILPDSFLYGEGVRTKIKEELLEQCNLHTIVRLPNGIFNPYTNIKTNILFFDKGKPTKEIWYFEHPYPPGQKTYTKSRPVSIDEFKAEKEWWANRVESDNIWRVSIKDIRKRKFNLDISSPYYGEGDNEMTSEEILTLLDESFRKSANLMENLKRQFK